jgi:hypothetical protein
VNERCSSSLLHLSGVAGVRNCEVLPELRQAEFHLVQYPVRPEAHTVFPVDQCMQSGGV